MSVVEKDVIEDGARKITLSVEPDTFIDELCERGVVINKSSAPVKNTLVLLTRDSLQTIHVIPSDPNFVHKSRSFDDYFNGDRDAPDKYYTLIVIHPYGDQPSLSKRTRRDYAAEQKRLVEYLKHVGTQAPVLTQERLNKFSA